MEEKKKRSRSANFSKHEENVLFSILLKYKEVVENKKTDYESIKKKKCVWDRITREFNSVSPNSCERTVESLKKMYENRKKQLRNENIAEKGILTDNPLLSKKHNDGTENSLLDIINNKTVFEAESLWNSDSLPLVTAYTENIKEESEYQDTNNINEFSNTESNEDASCSENYVYTEMPIHSDEEQWQKYQLLNLKQPITDLGRESREERNSDLEERQKKINSDTSRRRPFTIARTFSSRHLTRKYKSLMEKRLLIAEYEERKLKNEIQFLTKEHELRTELLKLDIEIKKKTLESMSQQK